MSVQTAFDASRPDFCENFRSDEVIALVFDIIVSVSIGCSSKHEHLQELLLNAIAMVKIIIFYIC